MVTVAYCRVSTEEQANEGFSIEGQTEKLRAYAKLHDLGEVEVIVDPGLSGKDMNRPGIQRLLKLITDGEVTTVLAWRLDRLSRDLGDLILFADVCGEHGVALHSFTENLDLSSAAGRMFYNILGAFAQFYREQLAENVRLGMAQGLREGRWMNRPPTGYRLEDGYLVPNEDAAAVRRVFRMRGEGATQRQIADATGINYSTVLAILKNQAYLGRQRHNDEWLPAIHEPLITQAQFDAAHRGRIPGRKRGRDLMSGRVVCGLCGRRMSITTNGKGQSHYRCKHRGSGCDLPARSNRGLAKAAGLGLSLLCEAPIRDAIQGQLRAQRMEARQGLLRRESERSLELQRLHAQRDKLLRLHYDDLVSPAQFGAELARLTTKIDNLESEIGREAAAVAQNEDVARRFEQLMGLLDQLDIEALWDAATEPERRSLLDELLEAVVVLPSHLQVSVHGAVPLNVAFSEVGLKHSDLSGVGGGT